jgi:hypothetical protein
LRIGSDSSEQDLELAGLQPVKLGGAVTIVHSSVWLLPLQGPTASGGVSSSGGALCTGGVTGGVVSSGGVLTGGVTGGVVTGGVTVPGGVDGGVEGGVDGVCFGQGFCQP